MDKYFIQYYSNESWYWRPDIGRFPVWHFRNGFSLNYKLLKDMGDFIWLKEDEEIPVDKGIAYVSVSYKRAIPKLLEKAEKCPDLHLVIGGPLFNRYPCRYGNDLPNFEVLPKVRVEDYFGFEYDPKNWGLEIPEGFENIGYDFPIIKGMGCNWGKCLFCKWGDSISTPDFEYLPKRDIPIIDYPGLKSIWLHTASLRPVDLKELFLSIPDVPDVMFSTYTRGDKPMLEAFKEILPQLKVNPRQLAFAMGVEIPSDRMLEYIRKGTDSETLMKTIEILYNHGCHPHLNFMLGYNNFTDGDVKNIESWCKELGERIDIREISTSLYYLLILDDRPIFKPEHRPGPIEPFPEWEWQTFIHEVGFYRCKMNDEQKAINEHLRNFYRNTFGHGMHWDYYDEKTGVHRVFPDDKYFDEKTGKGIR